MSINSVSPTSQHNPGLSNKERSKSVSERVPESAFSFAAERRRSKKCSIFDTISENVVTKEAEGYPQAGDINIPKIQKKSSKKVSIAENLNCDYSDISSLFHHDDTPEERGGGHDITSGDKDSDEDEDSVVRMVMNNLIIFLLLTLVRLFSFINQNPLLSLCLVFVLFIVKINSF